MCNRAGFPNTQSKILDYVEQRYLHRIRTRNVKNFGIVLAKSLLSGVPPRWEAQHAKIVSSLVAVRDRAPDAWPEISGNIARLLNQLVPLHRPRAIAFVSIFPDFWVTLEPAMKMAFQETVESLQIADLSEYRMLSAVDIPELRDPILLLIRKLNIDQVSDAIASEPIPQLWPAALTGYENSGSFRASEKNFRDLIVPFLGSITSRQTSALLDAIAENGQNWDATATPGLLFEFANNLDRTNFPSEARNRLYWHLQERGRLARYMHIFDFSRSDGWSPGTREDK
jgi:hypothetical protein